VARPKEFDEAQALDAAMRAFWTSGYAATSTEDLCRATGLGRSSVYNTFTSKRALFVAALGRYADEMTARIGEVLDGPLPVRDKVRELLWGSVDPDPADPVGCLVVNSMVELGPGDPEIAALLSRDVERRLDLLRAALEAARRSGEIDADRDPWALAHFVTATMSGMRVAARGGADRAVLEAIASTALSAL